MILLKNELISYNTFQLEGLNLISLEINNKKIEDLNLEKKFQDLIIENGISSKTTGNFVHFKLKISFGFPFYSEKCEFYNEDDHFYQVENC
jgi:hypothetical protein